MLGRPSAVRRYKLALESKEQIHGKAERSEQGRSAQREARAANELFLGSSCWKERRSCTQGNSGENQGRGRHDFQGRDEIDRQCFGWSWLWLLSDQGNSSDASKSFGCNDEYGGCSVRKESLEGYSERLSRSRPGSSGLQEPRWPGIQGGRIDLGHYPGSGGQGKQAAQAAPWRYAAGSILGPGKSPAGHQVTSKQIKYQLQSSSVSDILRANQKARDDCYVPGFCFLSIRPPVLGIFRLDLKGFV